MQSLQSPNSQHWPAGVPGEVSWRASLFWRPRLRSCSSMRFLPFCVRHFSWFASGQGSSALEEMWATHVLWSRISAGGVGAGDKDSVVAVPFECWDIGTGSSSMLSPAGHKGSIRGPEITSQGGPAIYCRLMTRTSEGGYRKNNRPCPSTVDLASRPW